MTASPSSRTTLHRVRPGRLHEAEIANVLKERLGVKAKKVPTRNLPDWVVRFVGLFDSEESAASYLPNSARYLATV